ncbi:hypothetical protein [Rhizobium leguminosarum]|uniref:hypothetical protein n=1 Tax=Rhizobium leguminosarum TaxID=384 RepID=UPI001C945DDD|nr:hypothetical protein [Rhizobium leguminosarum]MBY5708064.1 hypothetical protein [Rhizobium leguminosarum]MBY5768188.1 hypothetical protein [Rhizobium leguminosarum]
MATIDIPHPILYSTMTVVAYNVNKRFYGDRHYMWCTPYFGSDFDSPHFTVPPSSSPLEIYNTLQKEVEGGDLHATKIKLNRLGIRKGAEQMEKVGRITSAIKQEIFAISKRTPDQQFRPLLCVISKIEASSFFKMVDVRAKANPLSHEYILADLPQSAFDVIRIGK